MDNVYYSAIRDRIEELIEEEIEMAEKAELAQPLGDGEGVQAEGD